MWSYSIVAYVHIVAIIVMFASLIIKISFLKEKMTRTEMKKVANADLLFGLFAVVTVVSGLLRMHYFGKGVNYYNANLLFTVKFSIFILVGILSAYPTVTFLKLRKVKDEVIELKNYQKIRLIMFVEIASLLILPLLGTLIARGIGM